MTSPPLVDPPPRPGYLDLGSGIRISDRALGRIASSVIAGVAGVAALHLVEVGHGPRLSARVRITAAYGIALPALAARIRAEVGRTVRAVTGLALPEVDIEIVAVDEPPVRSGSRPRPGTVPTREGGPMGLSDKAENAADRVVGKVKEKVGEVRDDKDLEAEGRAQQAKGDVKDAGEKVKDAFGR